MNVHLSKRAAYCLSCLADHSLQTTVMNHKFRKKKKRSRSGPMRDELWGLRPMAEGGVGGVKCLITRARGAKRAVPPWTVSSTAGFPDTSGKPAQPGAHVARNCFSALRHIRVCSMFVYWLYKSTV
jgi:hypothetical protein